MVGRMRRCWIWLVLAAIGSFSFAAEPSFTWDAKERRLSAAVESAPIKKALGKLAEATGWKVFIDPQVNETISAEFKARGANDALKSLLGSVNFALVPAKEKDAPAQLYVFRSSMSQATELIEIEKNTGRPKDWIKNEIIVTLHPDSKRDIDALAKKWSAKIIGRDDKLKTYRLQFESEEAAEKARKEMASAEDVRVDDNYYVRAPDRNDYRANNNGTTPRGTKFDLTPTANADGTFAIAAVIDTPMQPLDADRQKFILDGVNVTGTPIDPNNFADRGPTHGTAMVESLLEGATDGNFRVLPINVYRGELDANGQMNFSSTSTYEVTLGVYEALRRGARVISLSLGGESTSPLLDALIRQGRERGVLFFAAAGNVPTTAPTYPAANPFVYAVTAADSFGRPASYANTGEFVDLIAPGTRPIDFRGTRYNVMGTSPATAFMSGIAISGFAAGQPLPVIESRIQSEFGWKR
jgi:hypothetical protein